MPAPKTHEPKNDSIHALRYRLGLSRPIRIERPLYALEASATPRLTVTPAFDLSLQQLEALDALVEGCMAISLDGGALLGVLDAWFARLNAQADQEAASTKPNVSKGTKTPRRVPGASLTVREELAQKVEELRPVFEAPDGPADPGPASFDGGEEGEPEDNPEPEPEADLETDVQSGTSRTSRVPRECSTCAEWYRRECQDTDGDSFGEKTSPSHSCKRWSPRPPVR